MKRGREILVLFFVLALSTGVYAAVGSFDSVGIGTSSPGRALHIKGEPLIRLENTAHGNNWWEIQNADPFGISQAFGIIRYENGAIMDKSFFISKEGKVGIGTMPTRIF